MPGMPKGILRKSPSHMAFCSLVKVHVSVASTSTAPWARPFQRPSRSPAERIGGQVAKWCPSGREKSSESSSRYCGPVSACTRTPRARAAATARVALAVDMWKMYRWPPVASASWMAREMASDSV